MAETGQDRSRGTLRRKHIATAVAFVCVMGLALFMRLYRIGEEGLHGDEVTILTGLYEPTFAAAFKMSRESDPPMTPVYFLIQYAWSRAVGLTVLRMHLLSVLFSAATFVAVFLIGRRLKGAWTGIAAMLLLAVSPMHVYYSLEIRNYGLTALLGALSLHTLLRGVERPSRGAWAANFAVDLLLGMSHLFANLLFVPQAIFLLACHRRRAVLLPWGVSHAVIAAVVAAWLRTCDFKAIGTVSTYIPPLSWQGGRAMLSGLTGASYSYDNSGVIGSTGVMGGIVAVLFLLGLLALLADWFVRRKPSKGEDGRRPSPGGTHGVLLLALTLLVPPALLALVTQAYSPCFLPRYVLVSALAAPMLMACAVTMPRSRWVRTVLAVALVLTTASYLDQILRTRPQRSVRWPICQALQDVVKPGDYLVMLPPYAGRFTNEIEILAEVPRKKTMHKTTWSQSDYGELAAWHAQGIQVWLVNRLIEGINAEFESTLGAYDLPFRKQTFKDVDLVLYCVPVGPSAFAAPDSAVTHVPLGSGSLRGWLAADRIHSGAGMGLTHLVSGGHPFTPLFTRPSLSLRSFMEVSPAKVWMPWDDLRAAGMALSLPSSACAETSWSLHTPANEMDCRMRYTLAAENAVDMLFEVTPRAGRDCRGPLVFTLASRVNGACSPAIHFPGVRDGAEGWVTFGQELSERGVVGCMGRSEEEWEREGASAGLLPVSGVYFFAPVYYGLVDGDQNDKTDDDTMAYILMLEHPEDTRFVLGDPEDGSLSAAWDWQYVLRAPEAGKTWRQRARMVYKPFLGEEDVLAEYRAWCGKSPSAEGSAGVACLPAAIFPSPGQKECDLAALADSIAALNPKKALDAYLALLELPLYRRAAADGIDACLMDAGDYAGLAAQWEAIAARDKQDALPWSRLGAACRRMGDPEKAAAAFTRGLERDGRDADCLLGLAAVRLDQGDTAEAAQLAGALAAPRPEEGPQAADLWARIARARLAAGDAAGAEAACLAALQSVPDNAASKIILGRLLAGRGETEKGLALFGEVIAANPNMAAAVTEACAAIAETCAKAGNSPGAVMVLRRAVAFSPGYPNYRMALGQALEAAGDDEGALAEYVAAMAGSPDWQPLAAQIDGVLEKRTDHALRVDLWRRLVDASPNAMTPRLHLALALEAAGDMAGAETVCQEALRQDPANWPAKVCLGRLRAARGDIDGGLALFSELDPARPDIAGAAAEACSAAAKARLAAGDVPGALMLLRRARVLSPTDLHYRVVLGGGLEAAGDDNGALEEYRAVVGEAPESPTSSGLIDAIYERRKDLSGRVGEWKALVARHPDAATPQLHLGAALEALGDMAGAEAAYRSVVQRDPANGLAKEQLGLLLMARGEISQGLALVDESVQARPDMAWQAAETCAAAAKARLEAGDSAGALAALRRAHALAPTACHHAFALAEVLETVGDLAGSEAAYGDALKCDAGHISAKLRLGALLVMRGDLSGGLALIDEAVSARPDSAGQAAGACAAAAKKRMEAGDAAGAVAALRRAHALTPAVTGYRAELAGALEAAGDDAGALEEYRAVVAAVPESPHSSERIDAIHGRRNAAAERTAEWRRMVAAHPDAAIPQMHLGLALEASGDTAGAAAALEKALKVNPDLTEARAALARLIGAGAGTK